MNYQSMGRLFRKARKKAEMSQFDVAQAMGCSRAQVDNIEVARQRAPLHRLEDFAQAVGLKVVVQVLPRSSKTVQLRTTDEMVDFLEGVSELDETERELITQLVALLPHLPKGIRATLRGIVTLWEDRYGDARGARADTA